MKSVNDKVGQNAVYARRMARQGNNPKRRIVNADFLDCKGLQALARCLVYVGSAHHKRSPGDYGFHPPANPRPSKSLCDGNRVILLAEARQLFQTGVLEGMFSKFEGNGPPKYVWCVDNDGEAYEAKAGSDGYHGYPLEDNDPMCSIVRKEWRTRCQVD